MKQQDLDIKRACRHVLSRPLPPAASESLARLAGLAEATDAVDNYGASGAVARLEDRSREILGKEAGLFFIKGTSD